MPKRNRHVRNGEESRAVRTKKRELLAKPQSVTTATTTAIQQVHPHNSVQYLETNAIAIAMLLTFLSFSLGETVDHINATYDHNVAAQNEINDLLAVLERRNE